MVQRVGVAVVNLLVDVVHELVGHNLQKVEIVVGGILRTILEFIVDFAVLHEHVEDCVLPVVDGSKSVHNDFLLALIAKSNRIYFVVHLQLVLLVRWLLHVLLTELAVRFGVTSLPEVQLPCDFRDVERTSHFALHARLEEVADLFRNTVLVVHVEFVERFFSTILLENVFVRVNMLPSQIIYYLVRRNEVDRCPQGRLDQETRDVREDYLEVQLDVRVLRRIRAHSRRLLDHWRLQHFVLLQ